MYQSPMGKVKEAIKALYKTLTKVSIPYGKGKVIAGIILVVVGSVSINPLWER